MALTLSSERTGAFGGWPSVHSWMQRVFHSAPGFVGQQPHSKAAWNYTLVSKVFGVVLAPQGLLGSNCEAGNVVAVIF